MKLIVFVPRRVTALALLLSTAFAPAIVYGQQPVQFTARAGRLSDAIVARDLARFDSLMGVALNARAVALVGLARDAYERNDDGALTSRLLVMSGSPRADAEARRRRPDLWVLLDSVQQRQGLGAEVWRQAVALEVALLRAGSPLLGAPSCDQWEKTAVAIAQQLRAEPIPVPVKEAVVAPALPAPGPSEPPMLRAVPSRVHFALDKSVLAPASRRVLDALVDSLSQYGGVRMELDGHTDPRGTVNYNMALSQRRVVAVRDYLVGKGVAATRLGTTALGKSRLELPAKDIVSHARNRRVVFRFFDAQGREIPTVGQLDDLQLERRRNK
jgi:outer membrane protein OmpA-like peptidoglycan-associated protein